MKTNTLIFRTRFFPSIQRFPAPIEVFFLLLSLALPLGWATAVDAEEIALKEALKLFYKSNYD